MKLLCCDDVVALTLFRTAKRAFALKLYQIALSAYERLPAIKKQAAEKYVVCFLGGVEISGRLRFTLCKFWVRLPFRTRR